MTTETEAPAAQAEASTKNVSIAVLVPPDFKAALQLTAEGRGISLMELIRQDAAEKYGLTLPAAGERRVKRKYSTPEEREAAQKAQSKSRRDRMSSILKAFENADPALKAQILASAGVAVEGAAPTSAE